MKIRAEQRRDSHLICSRSVSDDTALSTEVILSVSAEDSGIVCISLVTLSAMWDKASELRSKENGSNSSTW